MKNKMKDRRRTAFNVVDAGILLVLLAVLLVSVYFVFFADRIPFGSQEGGNGTQKVIYTLEIRGVDNDLLGENKLLPIAKGEELYHVNGSYVLGKIKSVSEATPYMAATSTTDDAGELIYAPRPDKSNFVITVEAEATALDGGYAIDGKVLRIGDTFTMATPFFTSAIYCKNIEGGNGQ